MHVHIIPDWLFAGISYPTIIGYCTISPYTMCDFSWICKSGWYIL